MLFSKFTAIQSHFSSGSLLLTFPLNSQFIMLKLSVLGRQGKLRTREIIFFLLVFPFSSCPGVKIPSGEWRPFSGQYLW